MLNSAHFWRAMRSLELFLLHPLPDSAQRARLPALRRLISRARASAASGDCVEAALLNRFDVPRQHDWPVAPLARLGDGQEPDRAYWLCADPVHLQVDRDALVLIDASRLEVSPSEAESLVRTLNEHFSGAGIEFSAPAAKRWYARLMQAPDIETVPLSAAAGRNVASLLPRGADALAWHRTFNEIQMVLHAHPVNEAREARGEPAVNSAWFWGGGTLPAHVAGNWVHVWARDPLARGLCEAAGILSTAIPHDFAQWLAHGEDGAHLIVSDEADPDRIEQWVAPALQALRAHQLGVLSLSAPGGSAVQRFDLARSDLWKFWRSMAA
jgi:hypothetical protein